MERITRIESLQADIAILTNEVADWARAANFYKSALDSPHLPAGEGDRLVYHLDDARRNMALGSFALAGLKRALGREILAADGDAQVQA